jgi:hypothetical protein
MKMQENSEKCRKVQLMQKNSINAEKSEKCRIESRFIFIASAFYPVKKSQ